MNKEKIVGTVLLVLLSVAGAIGLVNSDSVKESICGAPSAQVK